MNIKRNKELMKKFNIVKLPNDKFGKGVLFGLSHAEEHYNHLYKNKLREHEKRIKKLEMI